MNPDVTNEVTNEVHESNEYAVHDNDINVEVQEHLTQKVPCYKTKKFIIGCIIGIVLAAIAVVLVVIIKPKCCKPSPVPPEPELEPGPPEHEPEPEPKPKPVSPEPEPEPEPNTEDIINYKISSNYFESNNIENIITNFEDNYNNISFRRLGDNSNESIKTKKIKSKYLFNIISNENDLITAYIAILSRKEILEGIIIKSFDDSEKINNDNDNKYTAIAKVEFYKNGTINDILFPENINEVYKNELNQIIPSLIPTLNSSNVENIGGGDNKIKNSNTEDSNSESANGRTSNVDIEVKTKNSFANKIKMNTNSKIFNSEDENDNEYGLNVLSTINSLIKSIESTTNQTIDFIKDEGKTIAKKYEEKFKNINFVSTNKLRLLSNKNNIKLENENGKKSINIKNLRELQDIEFTQSLETPLNFKYEIFKINVLGLNLALRANIEWTPKSNAVQMTITFQRGNNVTELDTKFFIIENYNEVAVSYRTIITTIIKHLKEDILVKIDNIYDKINNALNDLLNEYSNNLDKLLDPLSKLFNDYLKIGLDKFKQDVFKYSQYCYNELHDYIYYNLEPLLTNIENNIKNGQQSEINNLIEESKTKILLLIERQDKNLTKLINSVNVFINNSMDSIKGLRSYENVGIDFYYRVKEIFKRIDVIIDSYDNIIINLMESEFSQLKSYVNEDIYLNKMDSLFDQIEIIWDIFYNNQILNETVYYDHATAIVNYLENARKRYLNIKDNLLSKVNETYENIKKNELQYSTLNIQSLKEELNENEQELIDLIKTKVLYITDYTIYNEDIQKITKIENEILNLKINAFETNIINKLNEFKIENFISSTEINSVKNEINSEFNLLLDNLKNNNVEKYKQNINNILSKFNNLISEEKISNIISSINNKINSEYLKTLINNYYKNLIDNGISKYSNLADEIINNSIEKYITKPVELIEKIKQFSKNKSEKSEDLNNKITSIVKEKLLNLINSIIYKIDNLISSQTNYIIDNIPNEYLDKSNTKKLLINQFKQKSSEYTNNLNAKKSYYNSLIASSFDILDTINNKEETIYNTITETSNALLLKFNYLFCNNNDKNCPNAKIETMEEYDKYYFQVSKFRDALNHLTLIEPYINSVISDDNLKNLSADTFVDLYKNPDDFDINTINGEIKGFLLTLIEEGITKTQNNVDNIKEIIKHSFTSGYNLTEQIYTIFFKNILILPKDLDENLAKIFTESMKKAREGYQKDASYHKYTEFYFNASKTSLETEFNNTIENYKSQLETTQENILNSLKLTNEFNNKIIEKFEDKIYKDINTYQKELILNLTSNGDNNCILLDNVITIENIIYEAINELKNEISSKIKNNITAQFESSLNDYKNVLKEYFNKFNNDFAGTYRFYFDSYRNVLLQYSKAIKTTYEVTSITNLIKNGFINGLEISKNGFENLINSISFVQSINNEDKINNELNNLFSKIRLTIPNVEIGINNGIEVLKGTCIQELKVEKDKFKDNVLDYIVKGFNNTIIRFIGGKGKTYLENLFTNDYENKIMSKLDYILSQSKEIDEYLYLILNNLYDVGAYLSDSVSEVYYQLMNYINDEISQEKVSAKILKKILDFKYDSAKKIVDYFKDYTLGILSSDSFKNSLSPQVKELITTYIPLTITLNLTNYYYEFLDSAYLTNMHNKYSTNIINNRDYIIKEIEKLRFKRGLQIGKLTQGSDYSNIATCLVEYNTLNSSLSEINNDFSFELSDTKKRNAFNLLASNTLIEILNRIPFYYDLNYEYVQKNITKYVFIYLDLNGFRNKINELDNSGISDSFNKLEKIRNDFQITIQGLFDDLENKVKNDYKNEGTKNTTIKPIDFNLRRLDIDINIEALQSQIDQIEIKIANLTRYITNPTNIINVSSKLNQINNVIMVQLISLDNTIESYFKYAKFYLHKTNKLNEYETNFTRIYTTVENILNDYMNKQSTVINNVYLSLSKYKLIFNDTVKSDLIEKINKILKTGSKELISDYLKNSSNNTIETFSNKKITDLTNLKGLTDVLGSTRLSYSTAIDNTIIKCGYNFIPDPNNYKVYLNLFVNGSSEAYISYQSDYYSTNVAGNFGQGSIELNLEMDFLNEIVRAFYKTEYNNTTIKKELYENTTVETWDNCNDAVECFENCPNSFIIENEEKKIYNANENDYYKNSSVYNFVGINENKLCEYSRYLYEINDEMVYFNSTLNRTV